MASSSGANRPSPTGNGFPWKPALATVTTLALLFLWHRFKDPATGLYSSIFADAFKVNLHRASHPAHKPVVTKPKTHPVAAGGRPAISPYLIDDSGALDPFFAALHDLETGKPEVVTVLHYGDSPTTADLITGDTRALLQQRFGDAGHGFNLIAKPWAWYGHRDVTISDHGWKSLTAVGSMRQAVYGLGGARFEGGKDAHSTFRLADAAQTDVEVDYFTEPDAGSFTVTADGTPVETVETTGDANVPTSRSLHLPAGTKEVGVTPNGAVTLTGLDFRRGDRGVIYDSLGLNGASTTVLSRAFDPGLWATEMQHAAPALVVINYGTNESSFGAFVDKQYEHELRLAVDRVRKALPSVPIMIMSPMDRGERAGLNEIRTMDTIPRIVAIQQRVAADLHCAFFDTFDAMGGDGTMSDWYNGKPRLVSADLIHPTPQGALIVAQELIDNLNLGYTRWEKLNDILPTGTAPASQACRPVTPPKNPGLTPPGTVAAPTEPVPGTGPTPAPVPTAGAQAHPLPPCPVVVKPAKTPAKAVAPATPENHTNPPSTAQPASAVPATPAAHPTSTAAPRSTALPTSTAQPGVSGDTGKNDRSTTGKPSPDSPQHP
ncbi:MAG TPA: GDSL-type esterase/lipase family protein [Acidobacteriaceae bacterium]|jgi:lysophospholipase L1-like esterase